VLVKEPVLEFVDGVDCVERSGGRGRKLQEPGTRWETRLKIWEMRRCWTLVSYIWHCQEHELLVVRKGLYNKVGSSEPAACRILSGGVVLSC
jgi:hypothetical protein